MLEETEEGGGTAALVKGVHGEEAVALEEQGEQDEEPQAETQEKRRQRYGKG